MIGPGHDEDCKEAVHRLYHFLDGELTEVHRRQIQSHLDACLPCLEAFDFEAELRIVVANRCRDEVPNHLRERIAWAIRHDAAADAGMGVSIDAGTTMGLGAPGDAFADRPTTDDEDRLGPQVP